MSIYDNVYLVTKEIEPISLDEVQEVEQILGIRFPQVYVEFITRFGEGTFCNFYRIYPPKKILKEYKVFRNRWSDYWFFMWDEHLVNPEKIQKSFIIGDNIDGDELVFYPETPEILYELPRHDNEIRTIKSDFSNLLIWYDEIIDFLSFMSWSEVREEQRYNLKNTTLSHIDLLNKFETKWHEIIGLVENHDKHFWRLMFHVPHIFGTVWLSRDKGTTRSFMRNGEYHTIKGDKFSLVLKFNKEFINEVDEFIASLEAEKILEVEKKINYQ